MPSGKFDFLKKISDDFTTLYVEDNEEVRQQTIKMLNKLLPNVDSASNGKEGFKKFNTYKEQYPPKKVDLIITDIQMPEQNGLEMIKKIREVDKKIPIIIFSAYDDTKYFMEAIKLGIDGYVLKPYPIEKISEVLNDTITKQYDLKNILEFEDNYLWDKSTNILQKQNQTIKLTKNESKLIGFLISNDQSIKPLDTIENYIFDDLIHNERRVRNIIARLNAKLNINIVESVYSQGYKIVTIK